MVLVKTDAADNRVFLMNSTSCKVLQFILLSLHSQSADLILSLNVVVPQKALLEYFPTTLRCGARIRTLVTSVELHQPGTLRWMLYRLSYHTGAAILT